MLMNEINELCGQFVSQLSPLRVYLFGSFADGTNSEQSDLDFYIVMKDGTINLVDLTARAYRAIREVKRRPVDIILGTVYWSLCQDHKRKIFREHWCTALNQLHPHAAPIVEKHAL